MNIYRWTILPIYVIHFVITFKHVQLILLYIWIFFAYIDVYIAKFTTYAHALKLPHKCIGKIFHIFPEDLTALLVTWKLF